MENGSSRKKIIFWASGIILIFSIFSFAIYNFYKLAKIAQESCDSNLTCGSIKTPIYYKSTLLELEYPEIFRLKPKEGKIGLEFFKYIYLFVISSLGFLLFIVLLYYGILWYTAGANIEQALRAKKRIVQAFLGAILLLGSWLLLEILGPQFTKIQKEIPPPQKIKTLPEIAKKEEEKVIVAKEIPLSHLLNKSKLSPSPLTSERKTTLEQILNYQTFGINTGSEEIQFGLGEEEGFARDNVPNSDASYNLKEAFVFDQEREQIKTGAENFVKKISTEEGRRQYKTTIREVKDVIESTYSEYCKDCFTKCPEDPNFSCSFSCVEECKKLIELRNKAESFPKNSEHFAITGNLEEKRDNVNRVETEFNILPGDYSHYKDEDYYEKGKNSVKEILNLNNSIDCGKLKECPTCSGISERNFTCENMKSTVEDFAKGWEIRSSGWELIKQAQQIAEKQAQYQKLLKENLKFGRDYLYEGTVASSRIERILGTNKALRIKSEFAKNLALTGEAISAAITALLVGGCHCFECGCGCKGDACLLVRPLLSALQTALGVNIVATPFVAQQLQKEIDKEMREKEELKKSLEELTEGLALAQKEIFTCQGITKSGEFKQLFSALEFLNYKREVEKMGYKVIIQKLWPNIDPEGDPFTFYCVTGPLVERISDTQDPNNLKNLKLYCDQSTESEVGELFDKIKEVIKGKEKILDQKTNEIKNAQKLVNEMRRNQKGLENDSEGLNNLADSKGQISENALGQIGRTLKNISGQQFAEMIKKLPEKYAKQAIEDILENIAGKDAKNFFLGAFEGMKDGDLKKIFNNYLSSMMDENVKKFSHAFLDAIPNENLKKILISGFDSFSEESLKNFWKNSFKNFTDQQKAVFFSKYFRDVKEEKLEFLYDCFVKNLSEIEKKQMLREIFEVTDQKTIQNVLGRYIKISLNPIQNFDSNKLAKIPEVEAAETLDLEEIISEIPSQELDLVLDNAKKVLKETNQLRKGMRNVSPKILESAISKIPHSEIKECTYHFYDGIETNDIKDFVLENVLDADPTFFQKFVKDLPEKGIRDLIVEQGFKAIPDSLAKDIFLLMHELPNMDPRKVLNSLFLTYVPSDKLSSAMNIMKNFGIFDQFLQEAASVFNFTPAGNIAGIIKDMVDKISSFTGKLQDVVNNILDTISLPLDQLAGFVRDVFNQIPNLRVKEILEDLAQNIPYQNLLASLKEFLNSLPLEELKNIGKEILNELPLRDLVEVFYSIIDELPTEEILTVLRDIIQSLPLQDLKNSLDKLSFVTKSEIFKNCIYPLLPQEEQLKWKRIISEEEWKYFLNRVQSKQVIYCALKYLPKEELKKILKDTLSKIPKENLLSILSKISYINSHIDKFLSKLPSEALQKILKVFPERELKNFFNIISKKLPDVLLKNALNKALSLFQNTVNNLFNQILSKLPFTMLNNLVTQLLSSLPVKQLVGIFNQIISQLPTQFLNAFLGPLQQLLGPLFSFLTGGPGLKQNEIAMVKYPIEYLSACSRCCHGCPPKPPCKGIPGPFAGCSPSPVLRRMALISINVAKIISFKNLLDEALNTEEKLIEEKIKKDIWPEITYTTKNLASTQCTTLGPGKEGYLVKCEDALRYGWVGKCDHKFNFVCCKRK